MPPISHDCPCPDLIRVQEQLAARKETADKLEARVEDLADGMREYALAAKDLVSEQSQLAKWFVTIEERQARQEQNAVALRGQRLLLIGTIITAGVSFIAALLSLWKG